MGHTYEVNHPGGHGICHSGPVTDRSHTPIHLGEHVDVLLERVRHLSVFPGEQVLCREELHMR